MITVAGWLLGIGLVRLAGQRERWLRAALLAQIADLVSFTTLWEYGLGEQNPLAHLVLDLSRQAFGAEGFAGYVATVVLVALKLGLLGYLAFAERHFGRYRRPVLAIAVVAGTVGAASNVFAFGNAGLSLLIVAPYALIAIRWPNRFRQAIDGGIRVGATVLLALGGLVADVNVRWYGMGYGCAVDECSPQLVPFMLALTVALYGCAILALVATLAFFARFLPWPRRVAYAR
ncbi:MAG TPA: hypothetical protein VNL94_01945 [Candidatus Binatia bacterium]|nr:hypothetical protein [Candidatus Binatia bacterium]